MHVLSRLIRLGVSSLFRLEVSSLFRMDVSMLFSRPISVGSYFYNWHEFCLIFKKIFFCFWNIKLFQPKFFQLSLIKPANFSARGFQAIIKKNWLEPEPSRARLDKWWNEPANIKPELSRAERLWAWAFQASKNQAFQAWEFYKTSFSSLANFF
jgi:hypothetical protein